MKAWLSNRKQCVVVEGECSTSETVKSDVPQGSVLGPFFFLLYINDITSGLVCSIRLFADDSLT